MRSTTKLGINSFSFGLILAGCGAEPPAPNAIFEEPDPERSGLDFVHFNGMSGELYFVEMTGSGAALLDYDRDGDLDLYLVQGNMLGGKPHSAATFPPPADKPLTDRLYRNDLEPSEDGDPSLRFTDVTESAGLAVDGFGMGVSTGDYDRDGWPDLYVTQFGSNVLLRNRGDGTFEDLTAIAGVDDPRWSTASAFADLDGDGWPDLYVCSYVDYRIATHKACTGEDGTADYCSPKSYPYVPDRLFRNRGDGTFEDVSTASGIAAVDNPCLGVLAADLNGDGRTDLYTANDGEPNQLWINQGGLLFRDEALIAGVAMNQDGVAEAGMGVDLGDFDNDGDEDLILAHLAEETNTLYRNDGKGLFTDATDLAGLGSPSRPYTGFGAVWLDYDNDGWLDIFIANGEVKRIETLTRDPYPLRQPNQLYRNLGGERFEEVSARAGAAFARSEVSRGAAVGDLDNDGDSDLLVLNNAGPARLLLNRGGKGTHWIGLRLLDGDTGSDLPGTRVAIIRDAKPPIWRRVRIAGSYLTASDPRVLVGLGESAGIDAVEVHWPDGTVERWRDLTADSYNDLIKGSGERTE